MKAAICYTKSVILRRSSSLPEFDAPRYTVALLNAQSKPKAFDEAMLGELRWWVDAWLASGIDRGRDSGPNMRRMCRTIGAAKSHLLLTSGVCSYAITHSGFLFATPFPAGGITANTDPTDAALRLFRQLALHPECEKLRGPCPTCGKYFLNKTRHWAKYCSRNCGSDTTARAANQKRNDDLHDELLRLSREALAVYVQKVRRQTWEAWTVAYLKKHGHNRQEKSLHRWVNDEKAKAGSGLKLPPEIEAVKTKNSKRRKLNG
ncbi:MAG: DUF6076 domain-containing protein [Terracidiphilus sp.]